MFKTIYDEENKFWSGRGDLPLYNPEISLAQVLFSSMEIYGPKIAQVYSKFHVNIENTNNKQISLEKRRNMKGLKSCDLFIAFFRYISSL